MGVGFEGTILLVTEGVGQSNLIDDVGGLLLLVG